MKTLLPVLSVLVLSIGIVSAQEAAPAPAPAAESSAPESGGAATAPVIQADNTAELQGKVGSEVVVEGVVKGVGKTSGDGITFLNFGDRKTGFVAVIFRSSYDKFPEGFDKYKSQKVRVRGTLEMFKDQQIQIKVATPDQIEIAPSAP